MIDMQLANELEASVVSSARDRGFSSEIGTKAAEVAKAALAKANHVDKLVAIRTFHRVANEFFANLVSLQGSLNSEVRIKADSRLASHDATEHAIRSGRNALLKAKLDGESDQGALDVAVKAASDYLDKH